MKWRNNYQTFNLISNLVFKPVFEFHSHAVLIAWLRDNTVSVFSR